MTFADFYRKRRGREPFPWMSDLAVRFAAGDLPDVLDLPTGCAKTEIVMIWAWAWQQNEVLPRRLWMVSDRRVIVDQTLEVAQTLTNDGVLVSRLRGGIVPEDAPALDPVTPQVISATVDQVGSRLLYRAYGSSPRSWPIWAGLAGNDSLIVLDEAHLSPTAEDTFRACARMGANIRFISMTATPRGEGQKRFGLGEADRNHPELGRRLAAKRIVELRQDGTLVEAVRDRLASGCKRVAVVCNTVREARRTFERIDHPDKHLIIGRQRPLDRDRIMADLLPRVRSDAPPSETPLVVVATQCIEAGADLDFDGMVSEACPIDALRQRLGRLDRLGRAGESRCILVKPEAFDDAPPYGEAVKATWRWLQKHAKKNQIDLGAQGWSHLAELVPDEARSSRPEAVTLLEPHLRMLARTSPRPRIEPDIDLLLHGPGRAPGDVSVVWRRDVDPEDTEAASEILAILPPMAREACPVPLWELRTWLAGQPIEADAGDVEGARLPGREPEVSAVRPVLRWDGQEDGAARVVPSQLRPGDVVVLPANRGGYDAFGWAPASSVPVTDLADEAFFERTKRRIERRDDPEAEVQGDRVHRWSRGVVVETFTAERRSRAVPREIPLDAHCKAVAERARTYARALGLDETTLYEAGLHHDDGKADWRWQLNIKGGDLRRLGEPPLAKGDYVRSPLARLPARWRHEAESLTGLPEGTSDLVRWLIATHHGYGRPFWPSTEHGLGFAELMDRLQAEHGYWRLALYEAALRCADRAVSEEEMAHA